MSDPIQHDEAYYEAQVAEAAAALAALRRPRLAAVLALLDGLEPQIAELVAMKEALPSGEAKTAVSNVISVLTSAPGVVRHEIASLPGAEA
ncbi:hypothetical protein D3C72_511290 [compost metagenome]